LRKESRLVLIAQFNSQFRWYHANNDQGTLQEQLVAVPEKEHSLLKGEQIGVNRQAQFNGHQFRWNHASKDQGTLQEQLVPVPKQEHNLVKGEKTGVDR
jgi:hypothetical protein